jgi:hypothetical protein
MESQVVPVTGRPAGWCEMIARMWPVLGVVGENGALYFQYKNKKMHRLLPLMKKLASEKPKQVGIYRQEVLDKSCRDPLSPPINSPGCLISPSTFVKTFRHCQKKAYRSNCFYF